MARKLTSVRPTYKRQRTPRTPGLTKRSWKRFRDDLLASRKIEAARAQRSICVDCVIEGEPYLPLRVDGHHIEPRSLRPDLTYEPTNVEFVCKRHHAYRNNLEVVPRIEGRFVVYGDPGVGKSTLISSFAPASALCWDPDAERSEAETQAKRAKLAKLVKRAEGNRQYSAWFVAECPRSAFRIATRIGARTVRLTLDNRAEVVRRLRACQGDRYREYEGVS